MRVLIAVGSKYGSSLDIAGRIGAVLKGCGHAVTVSPAGKVASVADFDAVIMGSGVYASSLDKALLRLAQRERAALATKRLAGFVVSLAAAEKDEKNQAEAAKYAGLMQDLLGSAPVASFAGAFDPQSMNLIMRWLMKLIGAKPGDYRDWQAIEAWAGELAQAWR